MADSSLVQYAIPIEKPTGWPLECAECGQTLSGPAEVEIHRLETQHDHVLFPETPEQTEWRRLWEPVQTRRHSVCMDCDPDARIVSPDEANAHRGCGHFVVDYVASKDLPVN